MSHHPSVTSSSANRPPVPIDKLRLPMRRLIHLENISGVALIVAALVALALANSPLAEDVAHFWHTHLHIAIGPVELDESLVHWVNDGLMTIFFLVAGLEIKRELAVGDLRDPRKAALPALAAAGGMIVPAVFYVLFAGGGDAGNGWGIPMATDIAFAVGILSLLGDRVPSPLKIFLLSLAIVDDLGAIVVIAVFYSSSLDFVSLGWAIGGVALMVALRKAGVWWTPIYVLLGIGIWYFTFESGVHATLAGVVCGLLAPATPHRPHVTVAEASEMSSFEELKEIIFETRESISICDRLINTLHPWSALLIIPVFALANTGVGLSATDVGNAATSGVGRAVFIGLVFGKPVGILLASMIAVRSGLATLPAGTSWRLMAGTASIAGIGFTVSLFISDLAFTDEELIADAKIGVLFASVAAGVIGASLIRSVPPMAADQAATGDESADAETNELVGAGH
ncbi:MAG: Na+/H+ antiporter NhaA [Acidimicrobiales bacterium]